MKAGKQENEGAKQLVMLHVEKFVLGVVAVMVLLLIYMGYSKPGRKDDLKPERIVSIVQSARQNIKQSDWESVAKERQPRSDNYVRRAAQSVNKYSATGYEITRPLNKPLFEDDPKRTDPDLYAPVKIEVQPIYGPVAEKPPTEKPVGASALPGFEPAETRTLGPAQNFPRTAEVSTEAKPVGRFITVITALVPRGRQQREFNKRFRDASGYSESRDVPKYLGFIVERAEVKSDGSRGEWVQIGDEEKAQRYAQEVWDKTLEETVQPQYLEENLVMPIPPLLLADIRPMTKHSSVKFAKDDQASAGGESPVSTPSETRRPSLLDFDRGSESERLRKMEHTLFRYFDMEMEPGKKYQYRVRLKLEDPNDPRSAGASSGGEEKGSGRLRGKSAGESGSATLSLRDFAPEVRERLTKKWAANTVDYVKAAEASLERARTARAAEDRRVALQDAAQAYLNVKYYQRRFEPATAAKIQSKVQQLRDKMIAAGIPQSFFNESQSGQQNPDAVVLTPWSEVSEPVSLSTTYTWLGAEVLPALIKTISGTNITYLKRGQEEPRGRVMLLRWDRDLAVDLPGEEKVRLGDILNFQTDAPVVDPIEHVITVIEDQPFVTDAVVVDMIGGNQLPRLPEEANLTEPGEILLVDKHGKLIVTNEAEDHAKFALHSHPGLSGDVEGEGSKDDEDGKGRSPLDGKGLDGLEGFGS